MKKVIISPYSRSLRSGLNNPKNYPWWSDVVKMLQENNYYIIQIGDSKQYEPSIGADEIKFDIPLPELENLVKECDCWISIDNFFPHFCSFSSKKGVVIFGKSDPNIFGYSQNINLLKGREHLKLNQFNTWEEETFDENDFISPEIVVEAVENLLG
jgi:ADP-heptose:LPS heptosyltransferase